MKKKKPRKYTDGFMCLEGTRRVPRPFRACCNEFAQRTYACVRDIRYEWWARYKNWFIPIAEEAGDGGIAISYCPHCGRKLKGSGKTGRYLDF
jgi:hypothetical protein